MLSSLGYADITGITTESLPPAESGRPTAKIIVVLSKAKSFDKAIEDYNKRVESRA
jgi:hypothetical protein